MSNTPSHAASSLLVGVIASNEAQRLALTKIVEDAGHRVVAAEQADVILSDLRDAATSKPTIVLDDERSEPENCLPSNADAHQIDAALRAVAAGLSIRLNKSTKRLGFEELPEATVQSVLTPRELDVVNAISAGLSNKAIARELGISLHTVKFHIESLLRKLGARTRAEAVAKALERRTRETIEL